MVVLSNPCLLHRARGERRCGYPASARQSVEPIADLWQVNE
jgi:hypothetical protein